LAVTNATRRPPSLNQRRSYRLPRHLVPEPYGRTVVTTGLPAHKSARLLSLAGAELAIHESRDRFDLATRITLAPPDVVLLDPVWNLPPGESTPSLQIGDLQCCAPPLLLWAGSSVFRGCATLRDVLDVVVRGLDDAPAALVRALSEARSAIAPQLIRCLEPTLPALPTYIAVPLCNLLGAPDPLAASVAWAELLQLPPSTLRRQQQNAGVASPIHFRGVARVRLLFEHYRASGSGAFDLATLPGAPSLNSVRHDLRLLGFTSRRALASATTGRLIQQSLRTLLPERTMLRVSTASVPA
jgi:hypothetical protein